MGGGGGLSIAKFDSALTNISTFEKYLWQRVEVKEDTETDVIWEGFLNKIGFGYNWVQFNGIEGLAALNKITARYNGIKYQGQVTAISSSVVTDDVQTFGSDAVGLFTLFTDKTQVNEETVYPVAASNSWGNPDDEIGNRTDLEYATDGWWISEAAPAADEIGWEIYWLCPNFANSTEVNFYFNFNMADWTYFADDSEMPLISIYNDTDTTWEEADNANHEGIGRMDRSAYDDQVSNVHVEYVVKLTGNIGKYFDGSGNIRMKVTIGDPYGTAPKLDPAGMTINQAHCTNYYSALFPNDTVYTIDAQTATTITFTDQNPDDDGVDQWDAYRVGDYIHNQVPYLWRDANLTWIAHDFDSTTIVDIADYQASTVGEVIQYWADIMNREVWQQIGWTVQCKSSYTDTTINLTEADICTEMGWNYYLDGNNTFKDFIIVGDGSVRSARQTPTVPSPLGFILNDVRLSSQAAAHLMMDNLKARHNAPKKMLRFTLDMDKGTDYSAIDIGKTVDINLYSGKINWTAGLIREISYEQKAKGHRFAELLVEYQG